MLSALLLCWAVLKLHAPGTCYPLQLAPSPPDGMAGDPKEQGQTETKSSTGNNFMEESYNGRVRKTIHHGSKGIFTFLKYRPKGCFSVLDVKSNKFFCLDSKRRLYTLGDDSNEDCWFRIKRHRHHDVLRSCTGDMLLIQLQMKPTRHADNSSELSRFRHKKHMKSRKRRSWHIDPTDPLGSEFSDVRAINNEIRQPQYGSNISKQTIALVEDPLQVLLSDSPRSPTQEKNRKNKKLRF